jgi:hypothetical protein
VIGGRGRCSSIAISGTKVGAGELEGLQLICNPPGSDN